MICPDFQEHPGWRDNPDKTVGVTWSAWCSECGFILLDKPFSSGLFIEGDGRRLGRVMDVLRVGEEIFESRKHKIACSKCVPALERKT